jgi:hypothetical protein
LAIGYERGIPFSTPARLAQFQQLADIMQAQRRDIVYAGGCTLDGLQYEFQRLNQAISFAALDGDGNPLTTGWEAIQALLTDVEYDYDQGITTLQFSSDQLELAGFDAEFLKHRLKIKALNRVSQTYLAGAINFNANSFLYTVEQVAYIDPDTGEQG